MEWLGRARITFTHAKTPIKLERKDGTATDLLMICKESTPPCNLNPFLFNGNLQTMWTAVKDEGPPVFYKRKVFEAEDPVFEGTYAIDFAVGVCSETDSSLPLRTTYYTDLEFDSIKSMDSRPMLVALHGLSGGSYEVYLRHVLAPLIGSGGWEACVVISRGCAQHRITSSFLYNARSTWDIRQTVKWLRKTFPNRPLFGIGFSLGANILTNYLAEEGVDCQLKAAVVCSNPWNLDACNKALQRTWLGLNVYSKVMGANMRRLVEFNVDEIAKNKKLDMKRIGKVRYLYEFDREVQGPTWGYPTEGAYYRDASSVDSLLSMRTPLFAINAKDDPITVDEAIPYGEFQQNPYAVLCTTSLGGHLSWFELGGHRWYSKPVINFLNAMALTANLEPESGFRLPDIPPAGNGASQARPREMGFDPMRRKMYFQERSPSIP